MKRKGSATKRLAARLLGDEVGRARAEKLANDLVRPMERMLADVFRAGTRKATAKTKRPSKPSAPEVFERWADLSLEEKIDFVLDTGRGWRRSARGDNHLAFGRITFLVSPKGYELDFDLTTDDDTPDQKRTVAFDWSDGQAGYDPAKAKALVQRLLRIAYAGKRRQH